MNLAVDPQAPYARLAVVGLICRAGDTSTGAAAAPGVAADGGAAAPAESEAVADLRWLLLHRVRPFDAWDPPGGRMEDGEDLTQAVRREIEEETGLAVEVGGPCYAFLTFYKGERLLAVSMACRPIGDPDAVRVEAEDTESWRWIDAHEWETLAAADRSSWDPGDVRRATRMAAALWKADEG